MSVVHPSLGNHEANMAPEIARTRYLLRKYVHRASENYWKRKRRSRADKRRQFYIEADRQAEEEKRRRSQSSAEIEEIQTAMKESEEIKAQIAASLEKERMKKELKKRKEREAASAAAGAKAAMPAQVAGRKRKSDATDGPEHTPEPRFDLAGRLYTPSHKRSRTETNIVDDDDSENDPPRHQVRYNRKPPRPLGRSLFSNRPSAYGTQLAAAPPPRRTIDNTYTDHFRLKAHGVDPETPMVRLSAAQYEAKHLQEQAENAARDAEPMPWKGQSTMRKLMKGLLPSNRKLAMKGVEVSPAVKSKPPSKPLPKPIQAPKEPSPAPDSVDGLLRQLKSARQEQEGDTEWFKSQNLQMAQEIETNKSTVQVHQTIERRTSSGTNSTGLMRSKAGYDFVPNEAKPGHILSRTEQRIRRTGARGLATAPIGGTPGYVKPEVGYLERTLRASLYGNGDQENEVTNGTSKGKERAAENSYHTEQYDDEFYEEEEYDDDEDDEEEEEEYDEEDEEEQAGPSSAYRGTSAFSGAGVSADDAIELDSD